MTLSQAISFSMVPTRLLPVLMEKIGKCSQLSLTPAVQQMQNQTPSFSANTVGSSVEIRRSATQGNLTQRSWILHYKVETDWMRGGGVHLRWRAVCQDGGEVQPGGWLQGQVWWEWMSTENKLFLKTTTTRTSLPLERQPKVLQFLPMSAFRSPWWRWWRLRR